MHLKKQTIALLFCLILCAPAMAQARSSMIKKEIIEPVIVPRSAWGADESWGVLESDAEENTVETADELEDATEMTEKQKECLQKYQDNPEDFKVAPIVVETDEYKRKLKWPRRYSLAVKTIVVHHTGEAEATLADGSTGMERVRAIYKAHTLSNGWGDIGYHYLIDGDGVIYEGRAGGDRVIGAHAYCANTGTVGVALIGNFQRHYPEETQIKALRKLLIYLTHKYDIDPVARIRFQGELIPTITGHRDHGSTQCPGRMLYGLLPAIRALVAERDVTSAIVPVGDITDTRTTAQRDELRKAQGFRPVGSIRLTLPPGGAMRIRMRYDASEKSVQAGERIAPVIRENSSTMLWQHMETKKLRSANYVTATAPIARGESAYFEFTVLAPQETGFTSLQIGTVRYTLDVRGKRAK